ncbi:MAG: YeeE/YedE family protein [Deltaproteobacteria bacterium]|nr:YeeE/YedE family protein [Deltaproteobacteria bacterium]NIS77643.1 YeeE/YedE family protein [Deltaproteobacteria bacterium]
MKMLMYGLVTGMLFGFLLQKARVLRYDRQLGALLFRDMTIVKFMLSAVLVGMAGVYLLHDMAVVKLSVKPTDLGANILGGLTFGAGWGLLGYCPGTSAGAIGEGRWDALFGIIGMIGGAALYAEVYPLMKATVLSWGNLGKITFSQAIGVNHWFIVFLLVMGGLLLFFWFESRGL